MKKRLQNYFALSEKGIDNTLKAAAWSFLRYITYTFPPMLTFFFLKDLLQKQLKSPFIYMGILAVITLVMYVVHERDYTKTYDVTYEESAKLRVDLANKLKTLPLSYFSTHNLAELSQTVMMDVSNIEMAMSHAIPQSIGFFVFFAVMTAVLCLNNLILGLVATAPIWITVIILFMTKNSQTKLVSKYYQKLLDNANIFQNAFEMQQEIKSYSMQESVKGEVLEKLDDTEKLHILSEFTMVIMNFCVGVLPNIAPVLVAIIGVLQYTQGQIVLLYYVGYLMAATTFSHQFANLSEFMMVIFFFGDSFKRLRDLKEESIQAGKDQELTDFDIVFNNVSFKYGDHQVIQEMSFEAKQNQVTALVGPSGCGKTTVLRLLSRLYDYDDGLITIGGYDIKDVSTKSLFDKISIVFQNVELFNTSVLENIRIGRKDATDEEVMEAAKLANVDKIIQKLPEGYHTLIGENGSKLSGGERQRISIARAFLKNAPIILLDEISASLDVENEMDIQESLNKLIANKTVLIISHRLKSIERVDQIIVMNEGRVDSIGQHEHLLAQSSLYASMVEKSHLTEAYTY